MYRTITKGTADLQVAEDGTSVSGTILSMPDEVRLGTYLWAGDYKVTVFMGDKAHASPDRFKVKPKTP
jgi:hypothetical protein